MGDPSGLRFVPASGSATPIDWTRVPEASKKVLTEQYGYDWDTDKFKPLPVTIADLAKMFDETKFFGYFESSILVALMDISELGLKPTPSTLSRSIAQVGPRFYMQYLNQVWFFLFAPGTRECIVGYSDDIIRNTKVDDDGDGDTYEKRAADETAMAEAFDVTLEQEVSRGMGRLVKFTNKLGGWTASTVQSNLEFSQYTDAIMTLPGSHPAHGELMDRVLGPLFKK
jgi:hypothetical protein